MAGVRAPDVQTPAGKRAKTTLESLVLKKTIIYEEVGVDEGGRISANVWAEGINVNISMRRQGYAYGR